jgi:hypothetical protein
MSVDVELWTREDGDLLALLPRSDEWKRFRGGFQFDGDGWLVSVFAPEDASDEVPAELSALVQGLRYCIELGVEPNAADPESLVLVREVMEAVGQALGGAGLDPESGQATSWAT